MCPHIQHRNFRTFLKIYFDDNDNKGGGCDDENADYNGDQNDYEQKIIKKKNSVIRFSKKNTLLFNFFIL